MDATRLLDLPLLDVPLCVIDVETTGAAVAYGDRIVEIGVARIERGQIVATYQQLLDPHRPMSGGAAAVTGITNAMLLGQPTFEAVWPVVKPMLAGAVLVGHNVAFDLSFFDGECRRLGSALRGEIGEYAVLDTVRLARKQFGRGGNGLQSLARRLDIPVTTAHRALADVLTTAAVLEKLLGVHGGWDVTLGGAIAMQGGPARPIADPTRKQIVSEEVSVALVAGQRVCITYLDAKQTQSRRTVTPMFVRRIKGVATLYAHCHLRNEQRTFKLDRIIAAVPAVDETDEQPGETGLLPYTADYAGSEPQ